MRGLFIGLIAVACVVVIAVGGVWLWQQLHHSERVDVRLPRDLLDKVDKVAKAEGVNRQEAVRLIIAKA